MPRFAANLSMMYPELPFLERFAAARADGFGGVEFMFPYSYPAEQIRECLQLHNLSLVVFNGPPGHYASGERGLASVPGREHEFADGVEQAVAYATVLGCRRVHFMAGIVSPMADRTAIRATYVANIKSAAARLARQDLMALIEPINTRDIPGYFLNRIDEAHAILLDAGAPNLRLQLDFYHAQITGGDLAVTLEHYRHHVGHVQIAGVPARNEPDTGEVNYNFLFDRLDQLGYDGWVGCEYRPARTEPGGTSAGLGWLKRYRN